MTYYLYHIPGKKIGVTRDLKERVENQQGYSPDEYEIIVECDDIDIISKSELMLQKAFGYKVDKVPYNKLKCNKMKMKINVTEQTTTFPCPVNKLKGQLMDNIGMEWQTEHGKLSITSNTVDWIMKNVKESMYNENRCYVYNKAFIRYYDNNDPYNGKTLSGALSPTGVRQDDSCCNGDCNCKFNYFNLIREWAEERGLYDKGDPKTQYLKLMEEAGEVGRALLKDDQPEVIDGIGDMVVVLTNLARLCNVSIEECIEAAYNEISTRKGKMINGTFVKN